VLNQERHAMSQDVVFVWGQIESEPLAQRIAQRTGLTEPPQQTRAALVAQAYLGV
jgi:hypothetical protein